MSSVAANGGYCFFCFFLRNCSVFANVSKAQKMEGSKGTPISQRTALLLKLSKQEQTNFGSVQSEPYSKKVSRWVASLPYNLNETAAYGADDNQSSQICSLDSSAGCVANIHETENCSPVLNYLLTEAEESRQTVGANTDNNENMNSGSDDIIDNDQTSQRCAVNSSSGTESFTSAQADDVESPIDDSDADPNYSSSSSSSSSFLSDIEEVREQK
ncbi:uncharacterized protein LOC116181810, partial [Photinus pyralis]|uniref:uncharacterized protein LOC116181810 n=1 Tax=Photinus pyralis TaxID=7054 RepID=UPI0012671288